MEPPLIRKFDRHVVGNVGLYYVCYRLSRDGWKVMPTSRNARRIDAVIYSQDASRTATLQIKALTKAAGTICPFVFHRNGERIGYFRTAWRNACKAAGCPGALVHDMRRSAVRTFERAGVPRSVGMSIVGHKTESIYRRYAIAKSSGRCIGGGRPGKYSGEVELEVLRANQNGQGERARAGGGLPDQRAGAATRADAVVDRERRRAAEAAAGRLTARGARRGGPVRGHSAAGQSKRDRPPRPVARSRHTAAGAPVHQRRDLRPGRIAGGHDAKKALAVSRDHVPV